MNKPNRRPYRITAALLLLITGSALAQSYPNLNAEIQRALSVPAVRDMMLKSGMEPAPAGVEETVRFHHNEIAKWGKLIKDASIRME